MYYEFDKPAALAADAPSRITEKGKYIGHFTRAECIQSKTGTEGIDLDFVTREGARARFALYTRKADGTHTYGFKQLMALLTCLKQNGLADPQPLKARVWDADQNGEVDKVVPQFTEMLGKPIGLLLHMEEYTTQKGEAKWRAGFAHAFEADTELMASEILAKKVSPEQLPKVLLQLKDRPLKPQAQDGGFGTNTGAGNNAYLAAKNGQTYNNPPPAMQDFEDEIPF